LWEAHQVRLAVKRLPPNERDIVRLQHFAQLSHREIAVELGLPIGTVKSRSYRAHRRLAGWLRSLSPRAAEPDHGADAYRWDGDPGGRRPEG